MRVVDRLVITGNSDRGHINLVPMAEPSGANSGGVYMGTDGVLRVHDGDGWNIVPSATNLPFWDIQWSGATAYAGGTAYASMTDSSAAILDAISTATTLGVKVVGRGTYRVDATITLAIDHDFSGATFVCSDTAMAPLVRIGSATNGERVERITGIAPMVKQAANTGTGWTGASVGIELANLYSSDIAIPYVEEFTTGVLVSSYEIGNVYNVIRPYHLQNNKRGMVFQPQDTTAWVNENTVIGGRIGMNSGEGTAVAGTRHILLETPVGGHIVNNNRFIGVSLEGNVPEQHIETVGAACNFWEYCRWESSAPKAAFSDTADAVGSTDNVIFYGYDSQNITVTEGTNSVRNLRYARNLIEFTGSGNTDGLIRLSNSSSSAHPHITMLQSGDSPHGVDPATAYLTAFGPLFWRGKRKTDTQDRIVVNTSNGTIELGPGGAGAPDVMIQRLGANVMGTASGDKWVANAGLGVGNSAAATVLGSVTRKMEVFDASGTSLGFVPIYDAIT